MDFLSLTSSINAAIEYYQGFKTAQAERQAADANEQKLNIACVFSPPAEGNKDVKQLQEDLAQEKVDNQQDPEHKKAALTEIMHDYNTQYGTNHRISEFDSYYQDIQQRIKDQKYPNHDYPQSDKIDITIVVDMLLTGFDSQYLNTLYVDKNLKHHGLIQAFSRTNRVLNDSKPYGQILDFRYQEEAVDKAIALFSGEKTEQAKTIWLVDAAPEVITQLDSAVNDLQNFMQSQGLACEPQAVANLKGDKARSEFINKFKQIQRLKTQLEQYTDISKTQQDSIDNLMPADQHNAFRGVYLELAQQLKAQQNKGDNSDPDVQQLEFEFVLFASALIDYDYIMQLIAKYTQAKPSKQEMNREQLIQLLCSTSNLMDEHEDMSAYINSLQQGVSLNEADIKTGYQRFKAEKTAKQLKTLADTHGLQAARLQGFVDDILDRMRFDGEQLSELLAPLDLGWRERTRKELALMEDLIPLLKKQAQGQDIAGLAAYE